MRTSERICVCPGSLFAGILGELATEQAMMIVLVESRMHTCVLSVSSHNTSQTNALSLGHDQTAM